MSQVPLVPGVVYHIYNRGSNGEGIFIEDRNYTYFMKLYTKYIAPIVETYAYCLLRNHFHLMVRIKSLEEINEHASLKEACSSTEEPRSFDKFISKQLQLSSVPIPRLSTNLIHALEPSLKVASNVNQ